MLKTRTFTEYGINRRSSVNGLGGGNLDSFVVLDFKQLLMQILPL